MPSAECISFRTDPTTSFVARRIVGRNVSPPIRRAPGEGAASSFAARPRLRPACPLPRKPRGLTVERSRVSLPATVRRATKLSNLPGDARSIAGLGAVSDPGAVSRSPSMKTCTKPRVAFALSAVERAVGGVDLAGLEENAEGSSSLTTTTSRARSERSSVVTATRRSAVSGTAPSNSGPAQSTSSVSCKGTAQ